KLMTVNVYDQANALESALRQSEEFQNMKEFNGKVNENPESKALFDEFREIQMNLQQKQMQGEEIKEEEVQKAQKSAEDIEKDEIKENQMKLQQKQMKSKKKKEQEDQKAQKSAEDIEKDENIKSLKEAEQKMSQLIQDLNRVIMKPIEELYGLENQN